MSMTSLSSKMTWAFLLVIAPPFASHAEPMVLKGDNSQLPKIDYNKTFDAKSYMGFDREFTTKNIEMKAIELPTYSGTLKDLPLTEWQHSKADFYTKSIELKDFEGKDANLKWSRQANIKDNPSFDSKNARDDGKQADVTSKSIETKNLPEPRQIQGQEIIDVINRGHSSQTTETMPIKVGTGLGSREIPGNKKVTPQPEKGTPQK